MDLSKKFLLIGSPNSGKTTLFNALTGLHQRTANYAGVTVEKHIGTCRIQNTSIEILDLPGIYSLYSEAIDERLAIDELLNTKYDGIVLVISADQLQKNLLLVLQVLDLKIPCVLVLNMIDEVHKKQIQLHTERLQDLLKVPVVETNARTQEGIETLKEKLGGIKPSEGHFYDIRMFQNYTTVLPSSVTSYTEWIRYYHHPSESKDLLWIVQDDLTYKHSLAQYIAGKCLSKKSVLSSKQTVLDKYLTHKVWGFVFLFLILLLVFQMVFFIAEYPMEWIEWSMSSLSEWLMNILPQTEWTELLINGVLPGITGVVMFVPQIALLFLLIGILEESGYMARISFLMDSIFSRFGLSGKSLIPLVSGVACAVPSVLSARTINNPKEKLITVMVLPFMSCSARLPVYTLLISLIFPHNTTYGFLNIKGLALLGLYLLGLLMALLYAWLFYKVTAQKKYNFFFIELPSFKVPYWKNVGITVWHKVKIFISDAGKIIVAISIILWYLSTHTLPSVQNELNKKYTDYAHNDVLKKEYQKELLERSYIGIIGKQIEPLIAPLGYDWKIGIALLTSFAAREVFVGTMATLYSAESEEEAGALRNRISMATHSDTGEKVFTTATNVSLLIYYALAMQCISTMVVVYKELKSLKWVVIQFVMMTGTAYVLAFIAYRILV